MNTLTLRQCQSSPAFRFKPFSFLKLTFVVATLISLAACSGGGGGSSTGKGTGGGNNEDTTAPTVSITPENNTTKVSPEPRINLSFSEAVSGVTTANVMLSKSNDGSNPITSTLINNANTYSLIPNPKLEYNTQYYVVLKAAKIKDAANNVLGSTDKVFSFTTIEDYSFTAWIGSNDSEVTIKNNLPSGAELYSYRDSNCDIASITTCPHGQMLTPNNRAFTDPAFNLTKSAYYKVKNQSKSAVIIASTNKFEPRYEHQTVTFKNKLWVIAGRSSQNKNDVWSSIDGISWKKETNNAAFSARESHQVVAFKDKLWLIGGSDSSLKNDIWSSSDGVTWTQVNTTGTIFSARYAHQVVVFDNKLWLIGGKDSRYKNDVWSSSDGVTWTKVTTTGDALSKLAYHRVVTFNNKLWIIGGMSAAQPSSQKNDVYSSEDGIKWTKVNTTGIFSARSIHQVSVFNNHIWVIGGGFANGASKNDVWKSADGISWAQVNTAGTIFSERGYHQVEVFNNKLWVIGGGVASNTGIIKPLNDVWSSKDGINWTKPSNSAAFTGRNNHQVVTFNNKFWMIGGNDGSDRNDVWSSSDGINWTQKLANNTSTSSTQFSPRQSHQVVSFNNKLWVIGGYSNSVEKNDVWSSSDGITWTQELANNTTTSTTQFSPRRLHQAVVFNSNIWVIGGYDGANQNDIWKSSDGVTWTKSNITGSIFSARQSHQALVFSSRIWVIGGFDGSNQNDVWYSTNGINWSRSTVSGPMFTARRNHRAVAFNNKLWVIGGFDTNSGSLNDVWSSSSTSPNATSWIRVNGNTSFSPRRHHQLIEFNNKLWLIGGNDGANRNDVWKSADGNTWRKGYVGELKLP